MFEPTDFWPWPYLLTIVYREIFSPGIKHHKKMMIPFGSWLATLTFFLRWWLDFHHFHLYSNLLLFVYDAPKKDVNSDIHCPLTWPAPHCMAHRWGMRLDGWCFGRDPRWLQLPPVGWRGGVNLRPLKKSPEPNCFGFFLGGNDNWAIYSDQNAGWSCQKVV